jgi:2-oxoglutarate ferredoxin oxidoreductase subunit delta
MAKEVKGTVIISEDRCKGCGLCTVACTLNLLKISEHTLNAYGYHPACIERMEECIGCGSCFQMCPDYAITVERMVYEGV